MEYYNEELIEENPKYYIKTLLLTDIILCTIGIIIIIFIFIYCM